MHEGIFLCSVLLWKLFILICIFHRRQKIFGLFYFVFTGRYDFNCISKNSESRFLDKQGQLLKILVYNQKHIHANGEINYQLTFPYNYAFFFSGVVSYKKIYDWQIKRELTIFSVSFSQKKNLIWTHWLKTGWPFTKQYFIWEFSFCLPLFNFILKRAFWELHLRVISLKSVRLWAAHFIDSFYSLGLGLMSEEETLTCLHKFWFFSSFSLMQKIFVSFYFFSNLISQLRPLDKWTEHHWLWEFWSPGCWMHPLAISQLDTVTKFYV